MPSMSPSRPRGSHFGGVPSNRARTSSLAPRSSRREPEIRLFDAFPRASTNSRSRTDWAQAIIVEPSAPLRDRMTRCLENAGFKVTAVPTMTQALDASSRGRPDVIVLDLQMPRLGGQEAYERIQAAWPTLARRVVFVTGDDARADSGDFLRRAGQPVVRKPFEIADLLAAVTAVAAPV